MQYEPPLSFAEMNAISDRHVSETSYRIKKYRSVKPAWEAIRKARLKEIYQKLESLRTDDPYMQRGET